MKKLIIGLAILLVPLKVFAVAADTEAQDLDAIAAPATGDVLYIVDDPSGTPASKKITIGNLLGVSPALDTDGTITDDYIDSADYAAGSIDAEHLAADIIDETKIADDGIDSEHYNDDSIDDAHINWGTGADQVSATDMPDFGTVTTTINYFLKSDGTDYEGVSPGTVKTALSLNNVENTTLSTWPGTSNITTVGTIASGTWQGTTVAVDQGGTGATSLTDGGVLCGSGTGAITALAVMTEGQVLIGDGTTDPAIATVSGAMVMSSGGICDLRAYAIENLADVTSANADYMMIWDATDGDIKKCDMAEVRGGASAAGGNDTEIQYNNATAFGGITGLRYDGTYVTVSDAQVFAWGSDQDWNVAMDESGQDVLHIYTTRVSSQSDDYGMITIAVDADSNASDDMDANQEIFEIGKGALDNSDGDFTELWNIDEDGDVTMAGNLQAVVDITASGTIEGATITESGAAVYSLNENAEFNNLTLGDNSDNDFTITFDSDTSNGTLNYDEDNSEFEFNADLYIDGTTCGFRDNGGGDLEYTENSGGAWTDVGSGGGGATYREYTFLPGSAVLDSASPPAVTVVRSVGKGYARFRVADFDASTDEVLYWDFVTGSDMSAGNWAADVYWFANDTGAGETCYWEIAISPTSEGDTASIIEQVMGSANTANEDVNTTEANRLIVTTITMSNLHSVAAGDAVTIRFNRDADNGSDDLTSDARLLKVHLKVPRS